MLFLKRILYTVKGYLVFVSNTNNLQKDFLSQRRDPNIPGQSEHLNNGNRELINILPNSRTYTVSVHN